MQKADLIVKNGIIVSPDGKYCGDIVVKDGKIAGIVQGGFLPPAENVIDAEGHYIIPGLVDPHTHLAGKFLLEEDFRYETPGAAAGGVTTIGLMFGAPRATRTYKEFPGPEDVVPWSKCFPVVREIGDETSMVDYFITPYINTEEQADEIPELAHQFGLTTYKIYGNMKTEACSNVEPRWKARIGWPVPFDDSLIYLVFEKTGQIGPAGMVLFHAENTEVSTVLMRRLQRAGRTDPAAWEERSPAWLEAEHCTRYSYFARKTNCRFYVVHLSSGEGLEACIESRHNGTKIIVETCPQYLTMTKYDPPGVLLKVNPPIRDRENNEALWKGIIDGHIQCIGTDHVITWHYLKTVLGDTGDRPTDGANDIWSTGSGFPGLDTLLPLMLSEGVHKGRITLEKLVEICCQNTAYHFGLYPKKGAIMVGSDADLVILDMDKTVKVTPEILHSRSDFTIYQDMVLKGWPKTTILRGKVIFNDGRVEGKHGYGKYLPRKVETLFCVP